MTIAWLLPVAVLATPALSASLSVPFDFTKGAIGIDVTTKGTPLYVILDTGVDPSVIDLARADTPGLKVDHGDGGEVSGFGDGKGAPVFPTTIEGLAIHGRRFRPFDALATDLNALSGRYGRKLDAVLGYSFLSDNIVLIDYPGRTLGIFARAIDARRAVRACRMRWTAPLTTSDSFPIIPGFRLGAASGPVSLDTGSNGGVGLFPRALDYPGVRASLVEKGTIVRSGARGDAKANTHTLTVPVGFGWFTLPAGQVVTVHSGQNRRTAALPISAIRCSHR